MLFLRSKNSKNDLQRVPEEKRILWMVNSQNLLERLAKVEELHRKGYKIIESLEKLQEKQCRLLEQHAEALQTLALFAKKLLYRPSASSLTEFDDKLQPVLEIDLSTARDTVQIHDYPGFGFVVERLDGTAYLKLNRATTSDVIDLVHTREFHGFFENIFLTNTAQPSSKLRLRILYDFRAVFSQHQEIWPRFRDYDLITLSNAAPVTNQEIQVSGHAITVMQSSGTWTLRANSPTKPALTLEKDKVWQIVFDRLYFS